MALVDLVIGKVKDDSGKLVYNGPVEETLIAQKNATSITLAANAVKGSTAAERLVNVRRILVELSTGVWTAVVYTAVSSATPSVITITAPAGTAGSVSYKVQYMAYVANELDDYTNAIDAALTLYSKHLPKKVVDDLDGDGSHDLDLPSDWVDEFSVISRVEYPIGNVPATLINKSDWLIYQTPTAKVLRLLNDTPETGESVRVGYTVLRAEADVRTSDIDAVASLAAANCLDVLANIFTQTTDASMSADSVDYHSKGDEFGRRAKALRQRYYDHMGIKPDAPQPGNYVVADAPADGRIRLTH
jgi:hypothetical protein